MAENKRTAPLPGATTDQPKGGMIDTAKDKARDAMSAAGDMAGKAKDKAQEWASSAADMAGKAKDKAQEWASSAADKVSGARETVGGSIAGAAGSIRDHGPQEGTLGNATAKVADSLEAAGNYIQDHDFKDMGQDVAGLIRRYPLQSMLVGFGLGFMLARMTRS